MTHPRHQSQLRWFYALVVFPVLAAYWPAIQGEFLMSDVRVLVDNPSLTSQGCRRVAL